MELFELQELWQQTDKKISENIQLNKEILRKMLISKPEKRLTWMRARALFNLILPLFITVIILIPNFKFQPTIACFFGIGIFCFTFVISYVWAVKYYLLLRKIKFSDSILTIKKNVTTMGQFKIKITRLSFLLVPIILVSMFLMMPIHITNDSALLKFSLFIVLFAICAFLSYRTIIQQHQKLNDEVLEIEELERNS
jgi:hypothetical protein